jgi:hypothetical protein
MSPQTLILPKVSPKKCRLLAERGNFRIENSTPSDSMEVAGWGLADKS